MKKPAKVMKANACVRVMVDVIQWAHPQGITWSIENPARSRMWRLFAELEELPGVRSVSYHACMFGAGRRKAQKLLTSCPTLDCMEVSCDESHEHEQIEGNNSYGPL